MKNKNLLIISVFISSFLQAQEQTITLQTLTGNIEGTLLLPSVEKPTIALIIAGSGPTDRDGNSGGLKMNYLKMLSLIHNCINITLLL